jgi:hypothetical protein
MNAPQIWGVVLLTGLGCTLAPPATANPFVPKRGHGTTKVEYKDIASHRKFTDSFGAATRSSATAIDERRFQLSGEYGLGERWALDYEMRAARFITSRNTRTTSADALGEQQFTFVRQVNATPRFADAVGLDIVVTPGLAGVSHALYALQPEYQIGTRGEHGAFTSLMMGPRIYGSGRGTVLRAEGAAGREISSNVAANMTLWYSATLGPKVSSRFVEDNVLRVGLYLRAARGHVRPQVGYERNIAGQGIRVAQYIGIGLSLGY